MSKTLIYVSLSLLLWILSAQASTVQFFQGYVALAPPYTTTVVGISSYSFGISLSDFNGAITVNPTSASGAVTFSPSSFTFTSASSSFPFTYVSTQVGSDTITWTVSGAGAANYDPIPPTNIQVNYRNVLASDAISAMSGQLVIGITYGPYSVSVDYAPPSGLTVTPSSTGATFTQALSFTSTTSTAQFSFTPTQTGSQTVTWTLAGANSAWYQVIPNTPLNVVYRTFTVVGPSATTYIAGQTTGVYTVSTLYPPASDVSLAISLTTTVCTGAAPTTSTSFVAFSPTVSTSTFTITSSGRCDSVVPAFTLAGTNQAQYFAPTTGPAVSFGKIIVAVSSADPVWYVGSSLPCGNSAIVLLTASAATPSTTGFSVALSSPSASFSPATLSFNQNTLSNTFTVTSTADGPITISYQVTGTDASSVIMMPPTNIPVVQKNVVSPSSGQFTTPSSTSLLVGTTSAPVHVTLDHAPSSGLVITPSAPGLVFNPLSLTFGPSTTDQSFTVTGSSAGSYTVVYTVSGADSGCYAPSQPTSVAVSLLSVQVTPAAAYTTSVGALSQIYTVSIPGLSAAVTLTPASLDTNNNPQPAVSFTPATLSLTPANPTATFQFTATSVPANQKISFAVSGAGASQVSTATRYTYIVTANTFTVPYLLSSTSSQFYAGMTSQPLIVTLSGTATSVNLIPTAPSTTFTPSVLTFTPGSLSQSFTITPLDAPAGGQSRSIAWTVNGTDADGVSAPAPQSYTALLRPFVVDSVSSLSGVTYIGTPVPFTVSTLYPPASPLTITPSGSFTISPASITISASSPSASFTVTPTVAGQGSISFTVTGTSANYYAPISAISMSTQQATITAVAPPNTVSLYVGVPSAPVVVRLSAPPSNELQIDVYSQQVEISPSTLTFSSTDTYKTFTFSALPNAFSANTGSLQYVYLQYAVSGPSASQFSMVANTVISVIPATRSLTANPTALKAQLGVPVSFTISSSVPPVDSLTVSPYVLQASAYYQISPQSATLTNESTSASFTVTAISYPAASAENIVLSLSGPDVNLYAAASNTLISVTPSFGTITSTIPGSLPFGKPYSTYMTLSQTASNSVAVEPYVLFGQPVTFNPTSIEFTPGMTWAPFTITPQAPGFTRIAYTVGGDSAGIFAASVVTNDITITPGSITTNFPLSLAMAGSTQTVTFTLVPPTANGLTMSISGTGLSFSPNEITFAPGSSYGTSVATALQNRLSDAVVTALSGPDAANYVNPCTTPGTSGVCRSTSGYAAIAAYVSATSVLQSTITFYSTTSIIPAANNVLITPYLPNVTFQPPTIALGGSISSATTTAYSTSAGTQYLTFNQSGPGASYFTYTDQSTIPVVFSPISITVTYPASVFAGVTSGLITLTVPSAPVAVVPAIQITPVTTIPGVVFSPSVMVIDSSQGELAASFTYTYSGLGSFAISYLISGPGATAYSPIASYAVTNSLGTIEVPPTFPYNYLTNSYNFIYGVQSLPFTMFVRGVAGNLTVQPISANFNFTPSLLFFSSTVNQITFTALPVKVGPAVISFNIGGPSSLLYARPAPIANARVVYRIDIPVFPRQTPGVAVPQTISISPPTNTSFVVDLAATQGNVIFNPSRLVFGPGVSTASFTTTGTSVSVPRTVSYSIPGSNPGLSGTVTQLSITGRSGDDNVAISGYPLVAPIAIPVVPGYFFIQHPRYQMGVPTKIRITLSNTPRSDVTLSLAGNNMQFEPPYAIFQNGGPAQVDIKVTPLFASSYEVNYAPFKIDYQVSGTNAGDYSNPSESYHYIALSQGYIAAIILMTLLAAIILIGMCLFFANKLPGGGGGGSTKTVNINS